LGGAVPRHQFCPRCRDRRVGSVSYLKRPEWAALNGRLSWPSI
jgi:hypothetical protein